MHSSIGQNIKSLNVSGLRCPVSGVQRLWTRVISFMDQSSPSLEHSFYIQCTSEIFLETW